MSERSSALFTNSQREGLLRGLSSEASDRKLRQRIRARIRNSAVDLQLGFRRLDDEDFQTAFRANLEPVEELRRELDDLSQGSRVFMQCLEEFEVQLRRVTDTVDDLEESVHQVSSMAIEREDGSKTLEETVPERRQQRLAQELKSSAQSLLTDVEELEETLDRLHSLDAESHGQLQTLKDRSEVFDVLFGRRTEGLQQWMSQFDERRRVIEHARERADKLSEHVNEIQQKNIEKPEEWDFQTSEISLILQDIRRRAEDLRKWRDRITHRRSARMALRDLSELHFDPGMRDPVVEAIAFFLRATHVVGANTEEILEDAIKTNVQIQQPGRVLDTVDVTIETEDREKALESAEEKRSYQQFSNAEFRAMFKNRDFRGAEFAEQVRISHHDLIDLILDDPSQIEDGLKITGLHVPIEYYELEIHVDLVGVDAGERAVLIDVVESASKDDIEHKVTQLQTILAEAEFGKESPSRGIIVVDTMVDGEDWKNVLDISLTDNVDVYQVK